MFFPQQAILTVVLAFIATQVVAQDEGLTVHIAEGDVVGTLVSPTVRRFLGIPYAVADRWTPPRSTPIRNTPFNASSFGDSCPQAMPPAMMKVLGFFGSAGGSESEDCLNINIWAPSTSRKQGTAVMIWIYGGGLQYGTSNTNIYNGQYFVQDSDDILVVSFNYRTNIFGQPGAPQLSVNTTRSQNFGVLDLNAAVQWVYNNIAAFGGDPERIILFGESAGAVMVDVYSYMHPNDTIVKGLIEQSGNLGVSGHVGSLNTSVWNVVSNATGCGTTNDTAQFDCMKQVPSNTLKNAVLSTGSTFLLVPDDITVFSDLSARAAAGNFLRVPFLTGNNRDEGDLFVLIQQESTLGFTLPVLTETMSDIQGQLQYICPTSNNVAAHVGAGVSTWRYEYDGIFPDLSALPELRAYHSSEIPLVFGALPTPNATTNTPPPTADELAFSSYMQRAWVSFARDPAKGLLNYGWPLYNTDIKSNATTLVQLGGFYNRTGASFVPGRLLDYTCSAQDVLGGVLLQLQNLSSQASIFQ